MSTRTVHETPLAKANAAIDELYQAWCQASQARSDQHKVWGLAGAAYAKAVSVTLLAEQEYQKAVTEIQPHDAVVKLWNLASAAKQVERQRLADAKEQQRKYYELDDEVDRRYIAKIEAERTRDEIAGIYRP